MSDLMAVITEGEPEAEAFRVLSSGLLAQHAKNGHERKSEKFSIFLKDGSGRVRGGVVATCLWNGMEIDALWVDEPLRNRGQGRKLMEAAEAEGKRRGCTFAYTNTFTWQAPEFYKKLGYVIYGELENFPDGNKLSYFRKNL